MKTAIKILFTTIIILNVTALSGQNRIQSYIDSYLKTDLGCKNSSVGICVTAPDGTVIAGWNENVRMLTASTMKTVTAAVALSVLGPEYRFTTKIAYDGVINDGVLNGDLYIVGGADPLLGSSNAIAVPIESVFAEWTEAIKDAGISQIKGRIIGDERFFTDVTNPDRWNWGDIGTYYGSGAQGLSFAENLSTFELRPGTSTNSPVIIRPYANVPSEFKMTNVTKTSPKGNGNQVDFYPDASAPSGKFSGSYGLDCKSSKVDFSNKFAALTCAEKFAGYLDNNGISSSEATSTSIMTGQSLKIASSSQLHKLTETYSPPLTKIISEMLYESNNFYAETLLRTAGRKIGGQSDYKTVLKLVKKYINENFCGNVGYNQDDGSGLSRNNIASPHFFCDLFSAVETKPFFEQYVSSFPIAGISGTVQFLRPSKNGRWLNTIYMKSGSMSLVRCYCGYVHSEQGWFKFAIMFNNFTSSSSSLTPKIEGLLREIDNFAANYSENGNNGNTELLMK